MAIQLWLPFCLTVLALVPQIQGTWSQIHKDVGDNADTDTAALIATINTGANIDAVGLGGWTALHIAAGLDKPNMVSILKNEGANLNILDADDYTPLHHAVGNGYLSVVNQLLPGSNPNVAGNNNWTPLHLAVGNDFADAIAVLISNSANVNAMDSSGYTPLHIAVSNGNPSSIQALLASGTIDVNARDNNGWTALHMAAAIGDTVMLNLLRLTPGIQLNIQDKNGRTALYFACIRRYAEAANALLNSGADATIKEYSRNWSPLHVAVALGHAAVVSVLFQYGTSAPNYNAIDSDGFTPIMIAIKQRKFATMKQVVDFGVNLNTQVQSTGNTALHIAVEEQYPEAINYLLSTGIDDTIKNNAGYTALHVAVGSGLSPQFFAQITPTAAAKIDILDNFGRSAVHLAISNNNEQVLAALLSSGANPNLKNSAGLTPLILATGGRKTAHMAVLLAGGATPDAAIVANGWTALHIAAGLGYGPEATILVNVCDINKKELTGGYTPLHIAVGNNQASIVQTLIAKGANTALTDDSNRTPKQVAISAGFTNIANLFP